MSLLDYSAIARTMRDMEATKARMAGGLLAPPDAFQVPQQDAGGQPNGPPPQAPPPQLPPMLMNAGQPAPDAFANVANAGISDLADPSHTHRNGVMGLLPHILGTDRVAPELTSLLNNDPSLIDRVKPNLLRSAVGFLQGVTPGQITESRAAHILKLQDIATNRKESADLESRKALWQQRVGTPPENPEDINPWLRKAHALAVGMGLKDIATELGGSVFGNIQPSADASKVVGQGGALVGADGKLLFQADPAARSPLIHTFADGVKQSVDGGKTWERIGAAPPTGNAVAKYQVVKDDKTGKYYRVRVDGPEGPLDASFAPTTGKSLSGIGLGNTARVITAATEGPLVAKWMDKFEADNMKGGRLQLPMLGNAAAQVSSGPQRHDIVGALGQSASELYSNSTNPDAADYVLNGNRVARLYQLLAARGGSEAMAGQEAQLVRGGPKATEKQVAHAKQTRDAMFGKLGAVMQVLSDEQKAKLETAWSAIQAGDKSVDVVKVGEEVFGPGGIDALYSKVKAGIVRPAGAENTITQAEWAKLSKADQNYFRGKGYMVIP